MKTKINTLRITLVLLLMVAAIGTKANPVDISTARKVAMKFMNANTKTPLRGTDELLLATTYNTSHGDAAFHVFNTPNGFVIVSADDCATPILGYSDEGQFDMENIPIQLRDYLQGFVEQIEYGIENHLETDEKTARQWVLVRRTGYLNENRDGEVVEPLITAMWDQDCYYNAMCPENENGPCGHCVTGCVATAMSMILHYWGYPAQGTGSHTYTLNGYEQSVNFGETTYDWVNMPNQLTETSTQAEIDAVSTLIWHCGVAVNMGYNPGGSAAFSSDVPNALKDYFNYSEDMHLESRQDDESWMSLLKTDLNLGCPVYYSGNPSYGSGHAFVCDGYDVNNRFHFNWGWSGSGNGYFSINRISYHYNNQAIFNIHPNATVNHQVTASASPSDGGTIAGAGTFDIGSICTLTAIANADYAFMYWTEDNEVVSTQEEYSFRVRKDRDLVAHFATPFQIEVVLDPEEGGTVSGVGEYAYGSTCTLTAMPYEGYDFVCWRSTNGNVVSTTPTYSFIVTEATTVIVVFATSGGEQIAFADLNVKTLCVSHWDTNGDGELSYSEAAAVTDLGQVFRDNTEITAFEELQYFTGLTSIGSHAFYGCSNLLGSLYIPNSVTTIGSGAFFGCQGFTGDLIIPNSVTTIGGSAFYGCNGFTGNLIIGNSLTTIGIYAFEDCTGFTGSLIIPNSVTTIGGAAFRNCRGFTGNLVIPNSVTTIEWDTFGDCTGFTGSLIIPNSVVTIGNYAFSGCSGFTGSLTIPYSVTTIGEGAFTDCTGFTGNLIIPNSVTLIGEQAFWYCTGFTGSLIIPNSVTEIGNAAFGYCSGFTSNLTIGNSVTTIGDGAFVGCSGFTGNLTIPNCVTNIGSEAFYGCSGFTGSLTIGNSVTTIGEYAFAGCRGFTGSLNIPNSVTTIGSVAFNSCSGFTGNLTFGNSVTEIGDHAFRGCIGLTGSLIIPNSVTTIGIYAFYGCSGFTGSLTIGNSVTTIGDHSFYGCSGFTGDLTLGNSVTIIGGWAFAGCRGFTGPLNIPNSVTTIGDGAFWGCTGFIGSLTIPDSVTSLGNHAFYECSGFTGNLTLGNSVIEIGNWTFGHCSGFTGSLTIGNSVILIGNYAFTGCYNLTSVVSLAEIPPILLADNVFWYGSSTIPVYVPCGCDGAYSSISWGGFGNFMGLCAGEITTIANPAEGGTVTGSGYYEGGTTCTLIATANTGYSFISWMKDGMTVSNSETYSFIMVGEALYVANFVEESANITFSNANVKALCLANWDSNGDGELSYAEAATVTDLGGVFQYNWDITSFDELQYFIGLSSIAYAAFSGCSSLTSIVIPNSVTTIGEYAFSNCIGLTSIEIPNSVTTIGNNAFYDCRGLTSIEIPNSVISIGSSAFMFCSGLSSITIPNSVTFMASNPFEGCSGLEQIIVDSGNILYDSRGSCNAIIKTNTNELVTGCKNTIIPNSVTTIGFCAFYDCIGLTGSLTIPNSVTTISNGAFMYCSGLSSIEIPNSMISIGSSAFEGCRGLTSMTIFADNPPTLGSSAFNSVNEGIPVYVPCESEEAFTAVNWGGFNNIIGMCDGEITVTANPTEGGTVTGGGYYEGGGTCTLIATANDGYSFVNWTKNGMLVSNSDTCNFIVAGDASYVANFSLTGNWNLPIQFADVNVKALCVSNWDTNGDGELSYAEAATVTNLGEVFKRKSSITSFNELQYFTSLTSIDSYAFYECYNLTSVEIPGFVTSIGIYAFAYCRSLTSVEIPNSVTLIGSMAFEYCNNLISVEIPNSVTSIETNPFESCSSLEQIVVDSGNSFYDSRDNCNAIIQTSTNSLIVGCKSTIIPNTVTTIREDAFWGCEGLISIVIPNSVTTIGYYAFYSCNNLSSVEISNSVTTIGSNAFCGCSGLISVEIPNSVTTIGWGAFSGCNGLTSVEIPNSVTSMGSNPFEGCSGLEQIIVDSGNMVYDSRDNCNAIIKTNTNELMTGCKNTIIPNSVTSIGESAFGSCSSLTSIEIPNSVTLIGNYAFTGCYNLTSITVLADNPPTLYDYVFYNVNLGIPVYVLCGMEEAYTSISWGGFSNFIGLCAGEITAIANPVEGGTVTGGGYYESGVPCTVTATANEGFTFVNWTQDGIVVSTNAEYTFYVMGDAFLVANFIEGQFIYIGDGGTATSQYLPSYSYYNYSLTQQIYTAEEIGTSGMITSIAFFNGGAEKTRTYDFYMKHTTKSNFSNNTDWIAVSPSDMVFSGSVTMVADGWTTITFDTPFDYDGMSNVVFVADDNTGEYTSSPHMTCRVFDADGNQAIYKYEDGTNYNPYNSSGYSGTRLSEKNQIILVIENGSDSYVVSATANPTEGGNVTGGGTYNNGSVCTLMATPNDGYIFVNWTKDNVEVSTEATYSFTVTENATYVANFILNQGEVTQENTLAQGYNWWSTYIEQEGINGLEMLENSLGGNGVAIRSQASGYTDYYGEAYGWWGSLTSINNESSYRVVASTPCTVTMTGTEAVPSQHPITLNHGWTWMGYISSTAMDVNTAMAGMEASDGDMLKSQQGYSDYYEGYGWFGSLNTIEPGMGLMYYSSNGETVSFTYPDNTRGGELKQNLTAENNHWKPNTFAYPDNMTVMATIELDGEELNSEHYELAAFANGECRGSVRLTYAEPLHRHVAFLTISGKDAAELSFRLYDTETGMEYYDAEESLDFVANAIVGEADDLYTIHFRGTTGMDELAGKVQVYPNPVNAGERFSINVADDVKTPVHVEIVNALGVETLRATSVQVPAQLTAPATDGVYTLRITVEGKGTVVRKLVVK